MTEQHARAQQAPSAPHQLQIDWTRCDGHGLCAALLPENVTLDEWGFPIIDGRVPERLLTAARRAAFACPALALRLSVGR